jgi:hypothetical protein
MLNAGSRTHSKKDLLMLTIAGATAFWAVTFVTSLLPIAAAYRAAYTDWRIQTVWVDSLFAGLIIACGVSYFLLRSLDKAPAKDPVVGAARLGFVALVIITILVDVPRSLLAPGPGNAWSWYYFLVGVTFNAARFLLLGFAIGYLYKRVCSRPEARLFLDPLASSTCPPKEKE